MVPGAPVEILEMLETSEKVEALVVLAVVPGAAGDSQPPRCDRVDRTALTEKCSHCWATDSPIYYTTLCTGHWAQSHFTRKYLTEVYFYCKLEGPQEEADVAVFHKKVRTRMSSPYCTARVGSWARVLARVLATQERKHDEGDEVGWGGRYGVMWYGSAIGYK